ncbi:hypothetical protein D3C76_1072930 [compost metagenome]
MQDHPGACLADALLRLPGIAAAPAEHQPGGHGAGAAGVTEGAADQHRALLAQLLDGRCRVPAALGRGHDQIEAGQGAVGLARGKRRWQFGAQIDNGGEVRGLTLARNSPEVHAIAHFIRLRMTPRPPA